MKYFGLLVLTTGLFGMLLTAGAGEVLYNGIELPEEWPPEIAPTREPMPVPYLAMPPAVINIDTGRQLFVDDFLIYQTDLERTYYAAEYVEDNPVIRPDKAWEVGMAMPFSDGIWYDPAEKIFKAWYFAGGFHTGGVAYATSTDGIHWSKPELDVVPGTNYVLQASRDSVTVWIDQFTDDPCQRYKLFRSCTDRGWALAIYYSGDGIHWGEPVTYSSGCGDRTTVFHNSFRNLWVYSLRGGTNYLGRARFYEETQDFLEGPHWDKELFTGYGSVLGPGPKFWTGVDELDPPHPDYNITTQLYNLDAACYESLILGFYSVWHGQPGGPRPKPNDVCIGFSRDGFHFSRPVREPFYGFTSDPEAWNHGNVQSAGGGCLVVGDKLYFYCSGRKYHQCSTGLATLRRDGFASMDAGAAEGVLTTRPLVFSGKYLFLNVDCPQGHIIVEVLDEYENLIGAFSRDTCMAIGADSTCIQMTWVGFEGSDLSSLAGQPVRFRFRLRNGKLYSFWVSADESGASRGYVAAGGPGFTGPTDTVGKAAYGAAAGVMEE